MANDLRHILSGCLTASMLLMFCNMIKKDIDPLLGEIYVTGSSSDNGRGLMIPSDPWGVNNKEKVLTPCWRESTISKPRESRGFIFVALAPDPEYHVSQIANAVVVAKYLGATIVVPNLRGSEPGQKRKFGEIYDLNKFVSSLDEKVAVAMDSQSAEISNQRLTTVTVPNMVSKEFIKSNIEPIFKITKSVRLSTFFPSTMKHKRMNPYACLGMFDTLWLRPELKQSIETMIETLRSHDSKSKRRFVAIDYRVETMPESKEIALFLKKVGFGNETVICLTLNGWHTSVEDLKNIFPNTFTKDVIIPANEKSKFQDPQLPELKQIVDFYVSSSADAYIPTSSNMFSENVVSRRIATGKTHVLVLANKTSPSAKEYIPSYISQKNHGAYSCLC